MDYADVELLLYGWLKAETGLRVLTELPANLSEVLPVIQVSRYGGSDRYTIDRGSVDIDCYAATRGAASSLASQVRRLLLRELPSYYDASLNATVSRVRTINAPGWAPYDNTSLRRFHASYMVSLHNH